MKTFEQFMAEVSQSGGRSGDYPSNNFQKDDDDEVKNIRPRAKGERDFAGLHAVKDTIHPVATTGQFVAKHGKHEHGPSREIEGGERTPPKQGSSDQSPPKHNGANSRGPKRRGDKVVGDLKPVMQGSSKVK